MYKRRSTNDRRGTSGSGSLGKETPMVGNNEQGRFMSFRHPGGERHNRNGGKFEGLKVLHTLLENGVIKDRQMGQITVRYMIPRTWEIPNGYHADLIKENRGNLRLSGEYADIQSSFLKARLPERVDAVLRAIVQSAKSDVLVVRSDSFCEDGIHPFAGEFTSVFVVLKGSEDERVRQLARAFKLVSASQYEPGVQKLIKQYGLSTSEQWMSYVVQEVHGKEHELEVNGKKRKLFFPDMSMVAYSKCLEPWGEIKRGENIARVAAGLGTRVVDEKSYCRTMALSLPATPGPNEVYSVSDMEKGDTGELDEYAARTQDSFHAIDMETGSIMDLKLHDVQKQRLCEMFPQALSGHSQSRGTIDHGISAYGDHGVVRATFMGYGQGARKFFSEAINGLADTLKRSVNFEVDFELAVNRNGDTFEVALVQLRPFGTSTESMPVKLSNVSSERVIARAENCKGHGEVVLAAIGVLLEKTPRSGEVLARLNDLNPKGYLLIGPDAGRYLGIGGAYQGCIAPGAVVDVQGSEVKAMDSGTHSFMNVAMQMVITVDKSKLNISGIKGSTEHGVLISSQKVAVQVDGETGKGQVYIIE